jgi:hypothetical protein
MIPGVSGQAMMIEQRVVVTESLAAVTTGADIEVVAVQLPDVGADGPVLRTGSRWRCRLSGSAIILLHDRAGKLVSVRRDDARFVVVRRLE